MPSIPIPQQVPIERAGWSDAFNPGGLLTPANNDRTPVNPINIANQTASDQAQNMLRGAQTASNISDVQQKQRSMQLSMLNGVLSESDPDKQRELISKLVPIANKLNPSFQIDPSIGVPEIRALAQSQIPAAQIPEYQMNQAKARFYNNLVSPPAGNQQADASAPAANAQAAPMSAPAAPGMTVGGSNLSPAQQEAMAIFDPAGSNALTNVQKLQYESPAGKQNIAEAETTGKNIAEAKKGVAGIDSRIQNAIDILNDQITLAPKTFTGTIGKGEVALERESSNIPGVKFDGPANQTRFEQNNANLFTQELPAIIGGMPGSRLDIPLVNAIKQASQINEYGTPEEKIASAQNLKSLLYKYQQNTHQNAAQVGAGNVPIPAINDANAQQNATTQAQKSLKQQPQTGNTPVVTTQSAFDALPSGAIYVEPDGKRYRKP